MTVDDVVTLIGNVGFPIVAYGALFYVMFSSMGAKIDGMTTALNRLSEQITLLIAKNEKQIKGEV